MGLRVKGRYDNGDDSWLSCTGGSGEWAVAFHGSRTVAGNIGIATSREIRPGGGQWHKKDVDINELSDNKGNPCGEGSSYFADDIEISAAPFYTTSISGKTCVFQARLCPSKIRIPTGNSNYRIVNEMKYARPYGICVRIETCPRCGYAPCVNEN